jgi:hypothetical protein
MASTTHPSDALQPASKAAATPTPVSDRSRRLRTDPDRSRRRRRRGARHALLHRRQAEYTIPKVIPKGVALQYLRQARESGHDLATPPLLIRVLGEDAYMALEQSKASTKTQLEKIVRASSSSSPSAEGGEGRGKRTWLTSLHDWLSTQGWLTCGR